MTVTTEIEEGEVIPEKTLQALKEIVDMDWPYNAPDIGEKKPGWQTGIAQLFFLMLDAPKLADDGDLEDLFADEDQQLLVGMSDAVLAISQSAIPILKTPITPGILIKSFLKPTAYNQSETIEEVDITDTIKEAIKQEEGKWLLCGAISPKSIISLLNTLSNEGFTGNLDVIDSNPIALLAFKAFEDLIIKKYPQINVNFIQGDLLDTTVDIDPHPARSNEKTGGVFISSGYYHGITADTIGTYIRNDEDLQEKFRIIFYSLAKKGVAFVRDMTEGTSSMTTVAKNIDPEDRVNNTGERLSTYIYSLLRVLVPIEYCNAVVENLFADSKTNRWDYLVDLWANIGPAKLIQMQPFVVQNTTADQRYFVNMVFSKK